MNGNSFTSFMDVIACGLGAAILLFLIGASAQRGNSGTPNDHTLLVRCERLDGNSASIGMEFLTPDASTWQLADTKVGEKEGFVLSSSSRSSDHMLSFLLLFSPQNGTWCFRPVLLDYAGSRQIEKTRIRLSVSGKNVQTMDANPADSVLTFVGETGVTTKVEVRQ